MPTRPARTDTGPAALVALGLMAAAALWAVADAARYRHQPSDLLQDYASGRSVLAGGPIYAPLPERLALPDAGGSDGGAVVVNDHPPTYVLLLCPLALLPYPTAFLLLAAANVASAAAASVTLAAELGWGRRAGFLLAAGVLAHPGVSACASVGNVSLVLFGMVVLGWRALRRGRPVAAGLWVGAAAAVKLYPGLLVLAFLARRQYRAAAAAAVVVLLAWGAAAAVVGPGEVVTYATTRAPENARAYVGHGFNLSVAGAAHRSFGPPAAASLWLERAAIDPDLAAGLTRAGQAAVLALVLLGLWRARADGPPDRAFAVLVPGMLLLCPLTWLHAVPMMALPLAVLVRAEVGRASPAWVLALAACAAALCLNDHRVATWWVGTFERPVPWPVDLVLLAPTWGMLGVLVLAATGSPRGGTGAGHFPGEAPDPAAKWS